MASPTCSACVRLTLSLVDMLMARVAGNPVPVWTSPNPRWWASTAISSTVEAFDSKCRMLAWVPSWHPGQQVPTLPTVLPAHSRLVAGSWLLLLLLEAAHVVAQDAEVPADTGRRCLPCHCAAPVPWRPAWELAASPSLLASGGHLDLANWQVWLFTCRRLPRSCLSPPDYVGPRYGAGLRLVPSFVQTMAYSVAAVMDAFWTPSCRSTSERRGLSSHLALIRLYSIFFVLALFLVSLTCDRQR